jgi:hypothetical protein
MLNLFKPQRHRNRDIEAAMLLFDVVENNPSYAVISGLNPGGALAVERHGPRKGSSPVPCCHPR